jgi:hypothetical protein
VIPKLLTSLQLIQCFRNRSARRLLDMDEQEPMLVINDHDG